MLSKLAERGGGGEVSRVYDVNLFDRHSGIQSNTHFGTHFSYIFLALTRIPNLIPEIIETRPDKSISLSTTPPNETTFEQDWLGNDQTRCVVRLFATLFGLFIVAAILVSVLIPTFGFGFLI